MADVEPQEVPGLTDLPLRRFLYVSPFFPPMSRVGALRPLKFARNLPEFGWAPVVLCDLRKGDAVEPRLLEAVPASTIVVRDYGRHTKAQDCAFNSGSFRQPKGPPRAPGRSPLVRRIRHEVSAFSPWPSESLVPLGKHSLDVKHAIDAGLRALKQHPSCEAIMVNADPYAAMIVGLGIHRRTGLPLIHDLRDPWTVCELRRTRRPRPQRMLVDRLERSAVEAASAVVLNTQNARRDYVEHYRDLDPSRFHAIRNHSEPELISEGDHPPFGIFTALFMGNFRRFVEGHALLGALAKLAAREDLPPFQLVVSGAIPAEMWDRIDELGLRDVVKPGSFVAYQDVGSLMEQADLLISFSHSTDQRIPAKVYDYLTSSRPVLVLADNQELADLISDVGGGRVHGLSEIDGIAETLAAEVAAGRQRHVDRDLGHHRVDSRSASQRLAQLLDSVTTVR